MENAGRKFELRFLQNKKKNTTRTTKEKLMDLFLEKILTTDKVICDNIDKKDALGVELLSQNIVGELLEIGLGFNDASIEIRDKIEEFFKIQSK